LKVSLNPFRFSFSKLFTIFVSGKLHQYLEFYNAHKSFVAQFGMNHEKNINKMRILSLMSLAENSKELPFDLLQKQLQITEDEIESFVIDGEHAVFLSLYLYSF
jgi:translation initiation factor 3 subunit M